MRMFNHSFLAGAFFFLGGKVEISSRTLIPLFVPGSVNRGLNDMNSKQQTSERTQALGCGNDRRRLCVCRHTHTCSLSHTHTHETDFERARKSDGEGGGGGRDYSASGCISVPA